MKTLANHLLDLSSIQFGVLLIGGDVVLGGLVWGATGLFTAGAFVATAYNLGLAFISSQWR